MQHRVITKCLFCGIRSSYARLSRIMLLSSVFILDQGRFTAADQIRKPYINAEYFTDLPWGTSSQWIQPWRAYMETTPASTFIDGTGINFNVDSNQAENVAKMLSKYGIRHARLDMNWGSFSYDDENRFEDASIGPKLRLLRKNGIRPLIVLNGNSRRPCPMRTVQRRVRAYAARGETSVQLDSVEGIIANYSGLSNLGKNVDAAGILIVSLDGTTAKLSKPLPEDLQAGAIVNVATLKYRPFGVLGSREFVDTITGWKTYVRNVARIARRELQTAGAPDGGFDLEIWNELTFGSSFLSVDNYYTPSPETSPSKNVWGPIVAATAATADSRPDLFSGVLIGDGFANTIPWRSSSGEPPRIDAIDKHPYASKLLFPAAEQTAKHLGESSELNDYIPAYVANFPEYWATGIRTDNILRDMAPIESVIGQQRHGRNARLVADKISPVTTWITEVNNNPGLDNPSIANAEALDIKGKTTLRYFCFFLSKGVTQLDLYAVQDRNKEVGDTAMSIVSSNFLDYAEQSGKPYPIDDRPFVSPALLWTGRVAAKMAEGVDRNLKRLRQIHVSGLAARSNALIFAGNAASGAPDLRALDVFAFLPYQVNAHRFVIPYYIMTRDVTSKLSEDTVSANLAGIATTGRYEVYDPVSNRSIRVASSNVKEGVRLKLPTTDYPRLLIVNDATP